MNPQETIIADPRTSWGKRPDMRSSVRAQKVYCELLGKIEDVSNFLNTALIVVFLGAVLIGLFTINFENLIFYDGTTEYCVLDGKSGELINVR